MNAYDKIRAALEAAIAYPNSTHAELKAQEALAALAELERAAAEPYGTIKTPSGPVHFYTTPPPAPVAEIERKDYALTAIIQMAERRQDCADILTIARTARLPEKDLP